MVFYHLALAYLSGPYFESFSGHDASDVHIEIDEDVAGIFLSRNELLNDAVGYSFAQDEELLFAVYFCDTFCGRPVEGFCDNGPSGCFLFQGGFYGGCLRGVKAAAEEEFRGFSFVLAYFDDIGV